MRRRWRNPRLRLERRYLSHSRPVDEVRKGLVVLDDGDAPERDHLLFPASNGRAPALEKRLTAGMIRLDAGRIELREAFFQHARDLRDVARIGMDVRIAARMDVAERPAL